jgi:hypothetical protein
VVQLREVWWFRGRCGVLVRRSGGSVEEGVVGLLTLASSFGHS